MSESASALPQAGLMGEVASVLQCRRAVGIEGFSALQGFLHNACPEASSPYTLISRVKESKGGTNGNITDDRHAFVGCCCWTL